MSTVSNGQVLIRSEPKSRPQIEEGNNPNDNKVLIIE